MTVRPALAVLAALLALGPGCKRKETHKVEIFDEAAPPALTEALGALAPPWPTPERVTLGDGLLVHWLREPGTPAAHLRLVLPTHELKPALQGAPALVAARAVALELEALAQRLALRVELRARAGRYEVAIHGQNAELAAMFAGLASGLSVADPAEIVALARRQVLAELRPIDAEAQALAAVSSALLGTEAAHEQIAHAAVQDAADATLIDAWKALTDPRRALLLVHAADPIDAHQAAFADIAERWRQRVQLISAGDANADPQALVRLRGDKNLPKGTGKRLTGQPIAPLPRLDPIGRGGRSLLVIGRTIATPTARERGLARLVQRRLQEELDVRVSVAGPVSVMTIHVPLSAAGRGKPAADPLEQPEGAEEAEEPGANDPLARRLRRELTVIRDYLRERPLKQQLVQAAQLWLGARMVAASIDGEDWTALWSEAIDLSSTDGEIAAALARDAQAMLAATPEEVEAFIRRWLDLEQSEPGWAWAIVGGEAELRAVVGGLSKGVQFEPPPQQ